MANYYDPSPDYLSGTNTFGGDVEAHIREIKEAIECRENKKEFIQRTFMITKNRDWKEKNYLHVFFRTYCKEGMGMTIPSEYGLVVFSVRRGIKACMTGFLDPGYVPFGQRGDVHRNCDMFALPLPGQEAGVEFTPFNKFYQDVFKLDQEFNISLDTANIVMFATHGEFGTVKSCLAWLSRKHVTDLSFDVMRFELLVMEMSKMIPPDLRKTNSAYVADHEGAASFYIENSRFDFYKELACPWHQSETNAPKLEHCAGGIAKRRVYNVLFYLYHLFGTQDKLKAPHLTPRKLIKLK